MVRLLMLCFILTSSTSMAKRAIFVPPVRVTGMIDFSKDYAGSPVPNIPPQYGNRVGGTIAITVDLVNISSVPQTGKISLYGGNYFVWATCSYPTGDYRADGAVVLCQDPFQGQSGNQSYVDAANSAYKDSAYPGALNWSIGPNKKISLDLLYVISGKKGSNPNSGCANIMRYSFEPSLKIEVNENSGAIQGSYGISMKPMSGSTCAGSTFPGNHFNGFSMTSFPNTTNHINAGRPF